MQLRSLRPQRVTTAVLAVVALAAATLVTVAGPGSPTAAAASASVPCPVGDALGLAGYFSEFIRGDAQRMSDSEGRVAYGGTATLGDPALGIGFSIGSGQPVDSVAEPLPNDPDRFDLIVGGQLRWFNVIVAHGSIRYGSETRMGGFLEHPNGIRSQGSPEAQVGGPTFSFNDEFAKLQAKSNSWSLLPANGTVSAGPPPGQVGAPSDLTLVGSDTSLNVFALTAAQLSAATAIWLKVPAGSTTLVNVSGQTVNLSQGPLSAVYIWDPVTGRWIIDDHYINGMPVPSVTWLTIRQSLLWNLPDATTFLKNYVSWPGTILAPRAAVELGRGYSIGPGQIDGSLIAASVTSAPGAETHDMVFVGCLPPVPVETGSVTILKRIVGDTGGAAASFSFALDCDGTMYDYTATVDVVPPATEASTTVSGIPVGAVCVLTETAAPPGWSLSSLSPHSVVVPPAGGTPAVFTALNTRDHGYVRVIKALTGDTVGADRSFALVVSCPTAGFERTVELSVPAGSTSSFQDVGPLPTGVSCSVSEPTVPEEWELVSIAPASVVVGPDTQTPVEVTATNSRRLGELTLAKVVTGDTPPDLTEFDVQLDCENPVYDRSVTLGSPSPSQVTVTGLPVGLRCRASEPHVPVGWTNTSIVPAEVTVGVSPSIDVTITNDYESGSLKVIKRLDAPVPADVSFTVHLDCNSTTYDQDIVLVVSTGTDTASRTFAGLPAGLRCSATEPTLPAGYGFVSVVPAEGVTVAAGSTVDLTVNNEATITPSAILMVNKGLQDSEGSPAPALADTTFTVRFSNCTNSVPDTDVMVVVRAGDSQGATELALPEGTRCDVSEVSVPTGWTEVSVVPTVIDMAAPPVVTEVVATNQQQLGSLQVTKVVTGAVPATSTAFNMDLSCDGGGSITPRSVDELSAATHFDTNVAPVVAAGSTSASVMVTGLPVGASCTIAEPFPPTGYTLSSIAPAELVVEASPTVGTFTVTNQLRTGELVLTKSLQAATPLPVAFSVFIDCDGQGADSADVVEVAAGVATGSEVHTGIPAGSTCVAAEVHQPGWSLVSTVPSSVVVPADGTASITVTNASEGGVVNITKSITGVVPWVATTFSTTLSCGGAAPVSVAVVVPAGSAASTNVVSGLPDGVACTLAEPSLPEHWQLVGIQQSGAPTDGANAPPNPIVTNTMPSGTLMVSKTLSGGAAGTALAFDFPVDCTGSTWDRTVRVHIEAGSTGSTAGVSGQPTGLACTVTETAASGWTLTSASAVVTSPGGAAAAFVNAPSATGSAEVPLAFTGSTTTHVLWWGLAMLAAGLTVLAVRPGSRRLRRPRSVACARAGAAR